MSAKPQIVALAAALVLTAALALPTSSPAKGKSPGDAVVPNEVVVKLLRASDLPAIAATYGLDPTPLEQLAEFSVYRMRIVNGGAPRDVAEAIVDDPAGRAIYAEANTLAQAPEGRARVVWAGTGTPAQYAGQWAGPILGLPRAQAVTRGAGEVVAVLDTGVDATHPALVGRVLPGYDFVDQDDDPSEVGVAGVDLMFGHGTHVAGIVSLVAPDAMILPVRVLDPSGQGDEWKIAEAIRYAADPDGNPSTHDGADVINLSLSSTTKSPFLRDIIQSVTSAECSHASPDDLPCMFPEGTGPVIVEAAGNSASSTPEYPAGDGRAGTISVGASTSADRLASFSNYGSWVDVMAPGDAIWSSIPGGGYASWSGTSMAAPFVSGAAALVRSLHPTMDGEDLVRHLERTSRNVGGQVRERLDVAAAVLTQPH